jgi:hypothetical protein
MAQSQQQISIEVENVQPLHHPGQTALVTKTNQLAQGHSEMGGKALLAKKMAASGYVAAAFGRENETSGLC